MQLTFSTTIHLSAADCQKILTDYLKKEHNVEVESISFNIVTEICGYSTNEYECTNFKGATAHCLKGN